nr:hypothetical protein [Geotalea toluenoxydans]
MVDYSSSEIKIFDLQTGEQTRAVGRDSKEGETLSLPTNMALDKDGNIYVTNLGTCRIIKMDPNGKVLKPSAHWGTGPASSHAQKVSQWTMQADLRGGRRQSGGADF